MADSKKKTERRDILGQSLQAIEHLQKRLDDAEAQRNEPIAIVGMACKFPGADSKEQYWQLLSEGKDAVSKVPVARWADDKNAPDISDAFGGFLSDIDQFDAAHFGISGREAESLDPQQRLMLELSWEALEHAGIAPESLRNSKVGVFVGITTNDYARIAMSRGSTGLDVYTATGGALNAAAGRVSYAMGFNGPAMAIDTACSSSLVAVHLACQGLWQRDCDAAIAGGVNVLLSPEPFVCFANWGMMAPDGRCKTFDERADGFVRSEGCGVIVLKRLSDAVGAGDNILAVIRGTAVNQDGASSGLTVPNGLAQESVLLAALKAARVSPAEVGYVEAHGTGTELGDPIELEALAKVMGKGRPSDQVLHVGSVKTNIGHAESASGIAGVIKVVLAMQNGEIPKHLHFNKLNPVISLRGAAIEIPKTAVAWPRCKRARIAGISSFGFSGTNAHIVIEEGPPAPDHSASEQHDSVNILALSARTDNALKQMATRYRDFLSENPSGTFAEICSSAATGRARFPQRLVVMANNSTQASAALSDFAAGRDNINTIRGECAGRPKIAFLFTGQGSQYSGMGSELYREESVFRETFDRCAESLQKHLTVPLHEIVAYGKSSNKANCCLDQTEFTQPALFALEYALAELWRSWGIEADAVVGHSLGEYVAACVAGVITLDDALCLVATRARLMQALAKNGAMAAVLADEATVMRAIRSVPESVAIAAINAPNSIVISGESRKLQAILKELNNDGVESRSLAVSHAFHSPLMEGMLNEFAKVASSIEYRAPEIDLVLNVSGEFCSENEVNAEYWGRHIRSPVQFAASIERLLERGINNFLEIGPAPVLIGLAGQTAGAPELGLFASMREGQNACQQMRASLAGLFTRGAEPDWRAISRSPDLRRVELPRYPFQRKRFWLKEPELTKDTVARASRSGDIVHPFLGVRVSTPLKETLFESSLSLSELPSLRDHHIAGLTLFPAAAFIEIGYAAAVEVFDRSDVSITDGWFREPMILDDDSARHVQVVVSPKSEVGAEFEVFSRTADTDLWSSHAGGFLACGSAAIEAPISADQARKRCARKIDVDDLQARMREVGLEYGPSFRGLVTASAGDGEAFGELKLPGSGDLGEQLAVHPGILDAAFHLIGAALDDGSEEDGRFYLPIAYEAAVVHSSPGVNALAFAGLRKSDESLVVADITVWKPDGSLSVEIRGLQARGMSRQQFQDVIGSRHNSLHHIAWRESEASPASTDGRSCVVLGGAPDLRKAVTSCLADRGIAFEETDDLPLCLPAQTIIDLRACELDGSANGQMNSDSYSPGEASEKTLDLLRHVATSAAAEKNRLLLVTNNAQAIRPADIVRPDATAIWGVAATAAAELSGTDLRIFDIDTVLAADAIVDAATSSDMETCSAWRDGIRFVPRLLRATDGGPNLQLVATGRYALTAVQRGTISGIALQPAKRVSPDRGQVEIEVLASGLNFRDVLNVLDMYPGPAGELGNECCGRVVKTGPGVDKFSVGELVTCIAEATYGSHVIADESLTFPVPKTLSLAQAATFPIAQLTAYLSLCEIGGMRAGDHVLIHAGAGGVGLAAVHLALSAGATVLATAGSAEKRDYLKSLGVVETFDSRQTLSSDALLNTTGGRGIDLLLNSLVGDSIDEGLRSLAPGGRFLEIGLREIRTDKEVASIRSDVSYHPILLGDYCRDEPSLVQQMFDKLTQLLSEGKIPAPRVQSFPITEVVEAFGFMAKARHIGRIAVTHPLIGKCGIRADSSYLVTGGLGGLGLQMAAWLADGGAEHIILMGRNGPGDVAGRQIDQLRDRGIVVEIACGDVADEKGLPLEANSARPPIRGVIHAAGIVDDAILSRVDADRLRRVMHPKAGGVLNIIRATEDTDLDFLALFSSASSVLGSPGQAAYSAANAFLDGSAHLLRSEGRAAVSINWGAWDGGGMVSTLDERVTQGWAARGIGVLSVAEGIRALEFAIGSGLPQVAALPFDWQTFFDTIGGNDIPRFLSELGRIHTASTGSKTRSDSNFRDSLTGFSDKQRLSVLTKKLRSEIAAVLGVDGNEIEIRAGLTEQGMDSLMAVELAGRISRLLGFTLATTFAFDYPTLGNLAAHLSDLLAPVAANDKDESATDEEITSPDFDDLTESELEAALRKEIDETGLSEEQE